MGQGLSANGLGYAVCHDSQAAVQHLVQEVCYKITSTMHLLTMEFWPTTVTADIGTRQACDNALSCCDAGPNIFTMNKRS